uniref:Uncharacterized protein n=1 Tax=Mus musculus TaxID=10090 RepID=Q3THQ2_MOUSE|nr:unnamed protein product [Mus musculus]BAE40144.1 unnamed protein product [Mus musculus]
MPESLKVPPNKRGHRKQGLSHHHCHAHTCIHVIGPSARLAAASGRRAACPRIEHIIYWTLHLTVVDGLGALGAAEEEEEEEEEEASQVGQSSRHPSSRSRASPDLLSLRLPGHPEGPSKNRQSTFICLPHPTHSFLLALSCAVELSH